MRDTGYTASALKYPLTEAEVRFLAFENGVEFAQVPASWWYAPNQACQRRLQDLAAKSPFAAVVESVQKCAPTGIVRRRRLDI